MVRRLVERRLPGYGQPRSSQSGQVVRPDADRTRTAQPRLQRRGHRHAARRNDRREVPRRISAHGCLLHLPLAQRLGLQAPAAQCLPRAERLGARRREHGMPRRLLHRAVGCLARRRLRLVRDNGRRPGALRQGRDPQKRFGRQTRRYEQLVERFRIQRPGFAHREKVGSTHASGKRASPLEGDARSAFSVPGVGRPIYFVILEDFS